MNIDKCNSVGDTFKKTYTTVHPDEWVFSFLSQVFLLDHLLLILGGPTVEIQYILHCSYCDIVVFVLQKYVSHACSIPESILLGCRNCYARTITFVHET